MPEVTVQRGFFDSTAAPRDLKAGPSAFGEIVDGWKGSHDRYRPRLLLRYKQIDLNWRVALTALAKIRI